MNRTFDVRTALLTFLASMLAVIAAGCASTTATPEPMGPSPDGGIEEIVVTSQSNAESYSRHRRPERALQRSVAAGGVAGKSDLGALGAIGANEEVWIIAKPDFGEEDHEYAESPGSGAMLASFPADPDSGQVKQVPLPLRHTDVKARISGYISSVSVTQAFSNPFDTKIEAVYLFPLPEKAAITEFQMIIGDRRIRGILREKEEAKAIYEAARAQGYRASLLLQHRPNVFEQKVANIEPGKQIDVKIDYLHTLAYRDGWYSFVFPTVVGPRFNPPGHSDPLHADARGKKPRAGGATVQYLRPEERSAHDISFDVNVDAGVAIEELRSSHKIKTHRPAENQAKVRLADERTIPNRDFLLEFRVAGETIKSTLLRHYDSETGQGYFTMMVYPPAELGSLDRGPLELVFVIDCSGSMRGKPLQQAKAAISAALGMMDPGDTFQIIRFSDNASYFGDRPVVATRENVARARQYLDSLRGTGGTMMIEGIKAALDFPHDPERLRFVTFLTDGYIGNESDIIRAVHEQIGAARIFSFGVGSSVNRYLLERMAKEGRGAVAYLGPQDSGKKVMKGFFDRIRHPAMMDLDIDYGSMVVTEQYPSVLPDLFVGRPVVVTGKYVGTTGSIGITGRSGAQARRITIAVTDTDESDPAIAKIWARLRIAELADRQVWTDDPHEELADAILATALQYQLVSDYTSFVAVDASQRTDGSYGVTVKQAVPVPDGVRYDTTVSE